MESMGQMLSSLRSLELKIGSGLYQARMELDVAKALGIALVALQQAQDELERLTDN